MIGDGDDMLRSNEMRVGMRNVAVGMRNIVVSTSSDSMTVGCLVVNRDRLTVAQGDPSRARHLPTIKRLELHRKT